MSLPSVAIVTGATGGIGKTIALSLASKGVDVVATDVSSQELASLCEEATPLKGRLLGLAGDIVDPGLGARLREAATRTFGPPLLLVNCCGALGHGRLHKASMAHFRRLIDINLIGPLRLVDAIVGAMVEAAHGRIILLSSRAWLGATGSAGYSSAKGGLVGAARNLALKYAHAGITVNCIAPGFVDTPMSRSLPEQLAANIVSSIPVKRPGTADDVSALVHYLADSGSGYITGQTLVACGGRTLIDPAPLAVTQTN